MKRSRRPTPEELPKPFDLVHHLHAWILHARESLDGLYEVLREQPDNGVVRRTIKNRERILGEESTNAMARMVGFVALTLQSLDDDSETGEDWNDDVVWLAARLGERNRRKWADAAFLAVERLDHADHRLAAEALKMSCWRGSSCSTMPGRSRRRPRTASQSSTSRNDSPSSA